MKTITTAMRAHLATGCATLAACWKIKRADGKLFAYTEHDVDITYQGITYQTIGGFNKTAIKSSGSLAIDNLDVTGFLSDDTIPDIEIRNGAFDYAEVEIFLVNFEDLSMGDIKLRYGFFGEVSTVPSGAFIVQLRGLVDLLSKRIGDVYVPECRLDLGEPKCGIQLIPPVWQGSIDYKAGDRVLMPVAAPDHYIKPIQLPNMSDEDGSIGFPNNALARTIGATMNLSPIEGSKMINITYSPQRQGSRTFDLVSGVPMTTTQIDSGHYQLRAEFWMTGLEYGQVVQWDLRTFRQVGLMNHQEVFDVGKIPTRKWTKFSGVIPLRNLDRSFTFGITIYDVTANSVASTVIDGMRFYLEEIERPAYDDYRKYGGLEFEAVQDGKTGATIPAVDVTPLAITPDGTTAWKTVIPKWVSLNEIGAVAPSSYQFQLLNEIPVPDPSYMQWGVVRFLSGKNAGFAVETIDYDPAQKLVTVALPITYQAQVGDLVQIQVGCDKRRGTCIQRFGNILNFRGHPDVPGQGQYFKVAGL